jgi:C-terminal processing protease CtpA/Prc
MFRACVISLSVIMSLLLRVSQPKADVPPPYEPYGIGAVLEDHAPYPRLTGLVRAGAAQIAGLKAEDQVIAIDGSYAKGAAPFYFFARKLQGPKGSAVRLVVLRDQSEVIVVSLKRTQRLR